MRLLERVEGRQAAVKEAAVTVERQRRRQDAERKELDTRHKDIATREAALQTAEAQQSIAQSQVRAACSGRVLAATAVRHVREEPGPTECCVAFDCGA